jgi:2-keto-4-pentenoate hydratase
MIDPQRAAVAAKLLQQCRKEGRRIAVLPTDCRPQTRADGYAIQAGWERASSAPRIGWKIAATSVAGQRHINVDGPLAGRLLAESVLPDGAAASLAASLMRVVEVEIAFRFGVDLPPRDPLYTVDEVMDSVDTLHPALELPDSRYLDFCAVGAPQLIADNGCADRVIIGPATSAPWRRVDLTEHEVSAEVVGKSVHAGAGRNVLGDPRIALAWLVNEVTGTDLTLRAGETVITGTCVVPIPVVPGDHVRAHFGALGELSVSLC